VARYSDRRAREANEDVTRFERDTAIATVTPGHHRAELGDAWWIGPGPNGGYMAAVLLRAIAAATADPKRAPRSLTVHYVRRPERGVADIFTTIERAGRSLSTVSARLVQHDRLVAVAIAALSEPRRPAQPLVLPATRMPVVAPLADAPRWHAAEGSPAAGFHEQFEMRWAIPETPWSGSDVAGSAAWVRLAEPRVPDAAVVALFADALPPAVFSVARAFADVGPVPTVDLTVHFRAPLPLAGVTADDFLLCSFTTRGVSEGFLEEDGEIWTADGVLVAQSRQLAVVA
jgi:acyl-CoA thioesterase